MSQIKTEATKKSTKSSNLKKVVFIFSINISSRNTFNIIIF